MSLFGAFKKSLWLPVELVKDVVTCGGAMSEQDKPYTLQRLDKIEEEIDE